MTTKRESQSLILALDSETRVTAVDFFDFAISLCGNLSKLPLTVNHRKSQYFRDFSEPLFYFLDINTTVSTCPVPGNMSAGVTESMEYISLSFFRSRARVAGSQDT